MTLTVICPVYNEQEVLEAFYRRLKAVLVSLEPSVQSTILFVCDRSTDNSFGIVRNLAATDPCVRGIFMSSRFGHQMALVAGMDHVDSDLVVMMDSDLQHPPELIPKLIEKQAEGYDIVYTVRLDDEKIPFFKRLTSGAFYKLLQRLSDVEITESAADYRLVSRRVVEVFRTQVREHNQFLRGLFSWVGFKATSVEFKVQERHAGRSKYSWARMFTFAAAGITSFSKKPLRYAIYFGTLVSIIAGMFAMYVTVSALIDKDYPSGWATLAVLISFFSGVQLIFLGVLGEYIAAIFDEVKNRPLYIIDGKIGF